MFVKPFRYERAASLADAAAMLREAAGSAKVLAGGQSLLPMMNLGVLDLEALIDVSHVENARGIERDDGYLSIGALTTHGELERDPAIAAGQPLVAEAARWIGSSRIRARGTLGGSLAHSDPAAELPLAMVVAGATYELTDGATNRSVPATEFHESYFTTALAEDELSSGSVCPCSARGGAGGSRRCRVVAATSRCVPRRRWSASPTGGSWSRGSVSAGVGDRPMRLGAVEIAVEGADAAELAERIGPLEGLEPASDISATAEHRRHLARVLAVRALTDAVARGVAA